MKQEMISFLSTCENDIKDLCLYLYNNPEPSYKEFKCSEYICDLMKKYNFNVTRNYLNINNAFIAQKGYGHPKVCYLCEYDSIEGQGHITGHNILSATSVSAAIGIGHIIDKLHGSVILIGCSGEYLGGTKGIMVKQEVFDDIDVVMVAHPYVSTCESGSSAAIIPLKINFESKQELSFLNNKKYTCMDALLLTINILNSIKNILPEDVNINSVISNGGDSPLIIPEMVEAKIYIRAKDYQTALLIHKKVRYICKFISELTNISYSSSFYEYPNSELITNKTLSRLFSHNLKENGIININTAENINAGLSIGDVSHKVPCIHPCISIIEDNNIKYGTNDFSNATISNFALNQCNIAARALASTAIDIIQNETLLTEIKNEFYNNIN